MTLLVEAAFDYNPDQPRDAHGRWSAGGGEGKSPATAAATRAAEAYRSGSGNRVGMGDVALSSKDIATLRESGNTSAPYLSKDGTWSPERQALHDAIVERVVGGVKPATGQKVMIMSGGGPASGKTEMIKAGFVKLPDQIVRNDPDQLKAMLPEVQTALREGDRGWAGASHEESSYLAARVRQAAFERGQNILMDTTGDSSVGKLSGKVAEAQAHGYRVDAYYINRDEAAAVTQAMQRGEKTGRFVPESVLHQTYASLRETVPAVATKFDSFHSYDNNGPKDSTPTLMAETRNGELRVVNPTLWNRFLVGHA